MRDGRLDASPLPPLLPRVGSLRIGALSSVLLEVCTFFGLLPTSLHAYSSTLHYQYNIAIPVP
jgi:hypothetical protein